MRATAGSRLPVTCVVALVVWSIVSASQPDAAHAASTEQPQWVRSTQGTLSTTTAPARPNSPKTGSVSTPVTLPVSTFGDMVVDGAHSHVFVSAPASNEVLVLDYQGNILKAITNEAGAHAMVLSGSTLYVTLSTAGAIDRINTATLLETSVLTQGTLLRPSQLVMANGALWTGSQSPDYNNVCIARVDLTTGVVTTSTQCQYGLGIRGNPQNTNMLITWDLGLEPATIITYSVATGVPVVLQSRWESQLGNLSDIAAGTTGSSFITASGAPYEFDEWRYSDLMQNGVIYGATNYPTAVDVTSASGGLMAGGLNASYGNSIWVYGFDQPGNQIFSGYYGAEILPKGLKFTPNGHMLFAVSGAWNGQTTVVTFATIGLVAPAITAVTPSRGPAAGGTPVTITGSRFLAGGGTCAVTAIHFGVASAPVPLTCTDTSITTTSPPGWPSSPDVTVTTTDSTSPASAADRFTYEPVTLSAASQQQYLLSGSDGSTWRPIDSSNLSLTINPTADSLALLGANADLFTADAGYNQDLAIIGTDNGGPATLVAWKESGGFAGTFSPNAAFVHTGILMTAGHSYSLTLAWKTNKNAPGKTIYAGAGPINGQYSPTRLSARVVASDAASSVYSTSQYSLANGSGTTWYPLPGFQLTANPQAATKAVLSANADLWTKAAGYNQDLGIYVTDNGGAPSLVGWKESGGYAGTYSPNAAFLQVVFPMQAGHTYAFQLYAKPNRDTNGNTIVLAPGPSAAGTRPRG
jgi:hypothetical protein